MPEIKAQIVVDGVVTHETIINPGISDDLQKWLAVHNAEFDAKFDTKNPPSFSDRLMQLCQGSVARSLHGHAMRVYEKLTDEEKAKMDNGTFRLPKTIILGMEPEKVLESQVGCEAIKDDVRTIRRLDRKRMY